MTGYGRGSVNRDGRMMTVELKSVNHRYLDISIRLPRHITFLEEIFRAELNNSVCRGHIDVFVNYRNIRNDARSIQIDEALVEQYILAGRALGERLSITDDLALSSVLRLPDVAVLAEAEEDCDAVVLLAKEATAQALAELKSMREKEGVSLYHDLSVHADEVLRLTEEITLRAPSVVQEYRDKLNERIAQVLAETEIDKARLSTEIALFADRAAIDEEIVRLRSHVKQFRATIDGNEPAGRRLDFIVQEMNREFNTIGSKANDSDLVNAVLLGKGEVEKLKEQVQNVE